MIHVRAKREALAVAALAQRCASNSSATGWYLFQTQVCESHTRVKAVQLQWLSDAHGSAASQFETAANAVQCSPMRLLDELHDLLYLGQNRTAQRSPYNCSGTAWLKLI